jgi:hypothetical protein
VAPGDNPGGTPPNPLDDPDFVAGLRPVLSGAAGELVTWPAVDLVGTRPDGTPVTVTLDAVDRPLLVVFLSTRCDGCETFWGGLAGDVDQSLARVVPVVVTKGPDAVDVDEVRDLAEGLGSVPVVMATQAWTDYRVTGYPFLVLVDPSSRRVLAESVGFGWADVAATIRAGLEGLEG